MCRANRKLDIGEDATETVENVESDAESDVTEWQNIESVAEVKTDEDDAAAKKSPSWLKLLKDFTQDTTLHGIRFTTLDSKFILRKFIWSLIVIAAFGVFIFYVIDRVSEYLLFRKNINVQENYVDKMDFPAITLCNQNRFRLYASAKGGFYKDVLRIVNDVQQNVSRRTCLPSEFECVSSGACIPREALCDTFPDCQDSSDEVPQQCAACPLVNVSAAEQPLGAGGTVFVYQHRTHPAVPTVYGNQVRANPIFLFRSLADGTWHLGSQVNDNDSWIASSDGSESPQRVDPGSWSWRNGTQIRISIRCFERVTYFPDAQSGQMDSALNMLDIYEKSGHEKIDMITACSWKTRDCMSDVRRRVTDLGLCYTFTADDMYVEQSGPGYGLKMTVNIEQYEYTKDLQTGVGVKVALHHKTDIPLMQKGSFGVSPGLYTMVAIEKTEIENLEYPWGNCSSRALKYYETYSVATCKMDCENVLAREKCGCRDIHMPKADKDDAPICSVNEYIKCIPKMAASMQAGTDAEAMRKGGSSQCSCTSPCHESVYLPSISFASISADDDVIRARSQEAGMTALRNKLTQAREISFRVKVDKYRQTMRMFSIVSHRISGMSWLLEAVHQHLTEEKSRLIGLRDLVSEDCRWLTALQFSIRQHINNVVSESIDRYMSYFHSNIYGGLVQFSQIILSMDLAYTGEEVDFINTRSGNIVLTQKDVRIDLINTTVVLKSGSLFSPSGRIYGANVQVSIPDDRIWRHTSNVWIRFATLRTVHVLVKSSIDSARNTLLVNLRESLATLTGEDYRLLNKLVKPLLDQVRVECEWCRTNSDEELTSAIRSRMESFLNTTLDPKLNDIESSVDELYADYLRVAKGITPNQREGIRARLQSLLSDTAQLYGEMMSGLKETLNLSSELITELLRLLTPKCQNDFKKIIDEYQDGHVLAEDTIQELHDKMIAYLDRFHVYRDLYVANKLELGAIRKVGNFTETEKTAYDHINALVSNLKDRRLFVMRVETQVNVINYWLMAQMKIGTLAARSGYWRHFDIVDPSTRRQGQLEVMDANQQAQGFWNDSSDNLQITMDNLRFHMNLLSVALKSADLYVGTFADGNQINEKYYSKNFLQLDVFYKSLTDKKVIQQKAYEYSALLSEMGGLVGLLLGASCLTFIEVIDLIVYNLFVKCFEWRSGQRRKRKATRSHFELAQFNGRRDAPFRTRNK